MIIPNYNKILIKGGIVSLFSGDFTLNEANIEKSFFNLLALLE